MAPARECDARRSSFSDMAATKPRTCQSCDCTSPSRDAFRPVSDGLRVLLCCPVCAKALTQRRRRRLLALLVLGCAWWMGVLIAGHLRSDDAFGRLCLFGCWTLLWAYLLVFAHEWGHAFCARLVGAPAYAVEVGEAPWMLDARLGGTRWRVGWPWWGGLTRHVPCEGRRQLPRLTLIVMGGPLVNLLIAVAAYRSLPHGRHLPQDPAGVLLITLAMGSALLFVTSIWPRRVRTPVGEFDSDGARILRHLRGEMPDNPLEWAFFHDYRARIALDGRDFPAVVRELAACDALGPPESWRPPIAVTRAAALCGSNDIAGAAAVLTPLLERGRLEPAARAAVLDGLAWTYLLFDESLSLERGLKMAEEACELLPWERGLLLTKICLLAALAQPDDGRLSAAQALLGKLAGEKLHGRDAASAAVARGLLAAARGERAARVEYQNAKSLHAPAALLRVLQRRLPSR